MLLDDGCEIDAMSDQVLDLEGQLAYHNDVPSEVLPPAEEISLLPNAMSRTFQGS